MRTETGKDLLQAIREKGVRLWCENGSLRYCAPKGALTFDDIARIRAAREELSVLLERARNAMPHRVPRLRPDPVPLTFTQLSHWHSLRENITRRGVASAVRIRGSMQLGTLQRTIDSIVRRHEALRTRIVGGEAGPVQRIDDSLTVLLRFEDLAEVDEQTRDIQARDALCRFLLERIDITRDELFGAYVVRLSSQEHVLLLAMEHVVSDGFSLDVLWRDTLSVYRSQLDSRASSLPDIGMQFPEYAAWQRDWEMAWAAEKTAYWSARMAGLRYRDFTGSLTPRESALCARGTVPIHIEAPWVAALDQWCRGQKTTMPMAVFTAYVALLFRWNDDADLVVKYQFDGRTSPLLQNAVGYFAYQLYLRVQLGSEDTFLDLLDKVTKEYCNAVEHADFGYLQAQVPAPEFTRCTFFNWIPQTLARPCGSKAEEGPFSCEPFQIGSSIDGMFDFDNDPRIVLVQTAHDVKGGINFPVTRFSQSTIESFGRGFMLFVRRLIVQPTAKVAALSLRE